MKLVKDKGSPKKKKKKCKISKDRQVPVVSSAPNLVIKIIDHLCFLRDEDTEGWF